VVAILSRYAIPYKTEILWLRDPIVGLLNYRKPYYRKVVIEVHQPLKIFEKVILKIIERSKKLIIAPISKELYTSLLDSKFHFNKEIFMLSPMGVPKSFFKESDTNNDQSVPFGEFKIGYVGGAYSAGVDHNISSLISCIDEFNSKSSTMKSSLSIFGLEADLLPSFQANFHKLIESKVLFLSVRQNHDTLVAELQKCNVFILPYPEGNYYKSSFPIKAMEYAALRRPILVTNTISHRNIFNTNEVWFYDPQSCSSLSNAMMDINKDSSNTNEKIKLAFNKSLNFTYRNRVENILKLI
jgi:glycosyltransferase involved in cell wall biosynthesis